MMLHDAINPLITPYALGALRLTDFLE